MDAEHRHELKQNDFVVYAKKTPAYIKEHWWESICIVVIIGAIFVHFMRKNVAVRPNTQRQEAVTSAYQDIAVAKAEAISGEGSVEELDIAIKDLLEKSKSLRGAQAAWAKIKAADALRAKLHYSGTIVSQDDIEAYTAEAIILYQQAIDDAAGNSTVEAFAKYGIALATQDAGNFDEAATLYAQIIANVKYDKTAVVELAKDKLDGIAMAKQNFTFVEVQDAVSEEIVEKVEVN